MQMLGHWTFTLLLAILLLLLLLLPSTLALFVPTPHSHFHYLSSSDPTRPNTQSTRQWFEGWYYRITLPSPNSNLSFVVIVSVEHNPKITPKPSPSPSATAVQVMGPGDSYFWQRQNDITKFRSTAPNHLSSLLHSGYYNISQDFMDVKLLGASPGSDPSPPASPATTTNSSRHDFHFNISSIVPTDGWGDCDSPQKSTAGWLAKYSLFDPHWQITMSSGIASGTILFNNETYSFSDAKFYAEKNWGSLFPSKWVRAAGSMYFIPPFISDPPHTTVLDPNQQLLRRPHTQPQLPKPDCGRRNQKSQPAR